MKKTLIFLLTACFLLALALPSFASHTVSYRLTDRAGLMTANEAEELAEKLDRISAKCDMDVVVVTTDTLDGKSPRAYADDFYDYHQPSYSRDGILLLVCTGSNDWYISTSGFGITAFTDAGIEYISDRFVPYLSDGEYTEAFNVYADLCDEFVVKARTGEPYDSWNLPKAPFNYVMNTLVAIGIGLVVAFIAMTGMKSQLNTVRAKAGASAYVKNDSLNVTEAGDLYLYSTIRRVRRETSQGSGTHRSSSGRSHGGGGGKF